MAYLNHRSEVFFAQGEDEIAQKALDFLENAHELQAQGPVFHK
jgi:hypothetical protein